MENNIQDIIDPHQVDLETMFDGLELTEELISFHAMNPFCQYVSSPRMFMFSSHMSQNVVLNHGDEPIIQTGLEHQLGKSTYSIKVEHECVVLDIIKRYESISDNLINATIAYFIIVQNLHDRSLDYIEIPYNFNAQVAIANGFKYRWNMSILNKIKVGDILTPDIKLASSPSIRSNDGYAYGKNVNMALMTLPDVAEDGVVISKTCAKELSYTMYDILDVSFGNNSYPLNLYGDINNYKAFPDIGEKINDDGVILALRTFDVNMFSIYDNTKYDTFFDKVYYGRSIGSGDLNGVVVDIKCMKQTNIKKDIPIEMSKQVNKYVDSYHNFCMRIINAYNRAKSSRHDITCTPRMHRFLIDCILHTNMYNHKYKFTFRNTTENTYRVQFVIQYNIELTKGSKISDLQGCKGVVVDVRDDDKMPIDKYGNRADIIMDSTSIANRMCVGRLYQQDFCNASRFIKHKVTNIISKDNTDNGYYYAYELILSLLKVLSTEQYKGYQSITDINQIKQIVDEVIREELYLYYKISSSKRAYEISKELKDNHIGYQPDKVYLDKDGVKVLTKNDVIIAPIYTMVLSKTAELYLSTPSSVTNHYGLPMGVNNAFKRQLPWANRPTKVVSETEMRLFASYTDPYVLAEIRDRANNNETKRHIYGNILRSQQPTNIDNVVDRAIIPYGSDPSLEILNSIFNVGGICMKKSGL